MTINLEELGTLGKKKLREDRRITECSLNNLKVCNLFLGDERCKGSVYIVAVQAEVCTPSFSLCVWGLLR